MQSNTLGDSSLEVFWEFTRGSFVLTVLPCEFSPTAINTGNPGLPLHVEIYFALLLVPSTSGGLLSNVEKIAVLSQGTMVINHNTFDVVPLADCVGFWLIPDDILGIKRSCFAGTYCEQLKSCD